jgi:hypothetical protein
MVRLSAAKYARSRSEVEKEIFARLAPPKPTVSAGMKPGASAAGASGSAGKSSFLDEWLEKRKQLGGGAKPPVMAPPSAPPRPIQAQNMQTSPTAPAQQLAQNTAPAAASQNLAMAPQSVPGASTTVSEGYAAAASPAEGQISAATTQQKAPSPQDIADSSWQRKRAMNDALQDDYNSESPAQSSGASGASIQSSDQQDDHLHLRKGETAQNEVVLKLR